MNSPVTRRRRTAFSLTEVLVAGACFCVCLVPLLAMSTTNQSAAQRRLSHAKQVATANMIIDVLCDVPIFVLKFGLPETPTPPDAMVMNIIQVLAAGDGKTLDFNKIIDAFQPVIEKLGLPIPIGLLKLLPAFIEIPPPICEAVRDAAVMALDLLNTYVMTVVLKQDFEGQKDLHCVIVSLEPKEPGGSGRRYEERRLVCRHL